MVLLVSAILATVCTVEVCAPEVLNNYWKYHCIGTDFPIPIKEFLFDTGTYEEQLFFEEGSSITRVTIEFNGIALILCRLFSIRHGVCSGSNNVTTLLFYILLYIPHEIINNNKYYSYNGTVLLLL